MKVFIGADHGGFSVKEQLKEQLKAQGYEIEDCGATSLDMADDYPVFGQAVAEAVAANPHSRGIALCRSGHGMVMAANKVPGARAVLGVTKEWAVQSHEHDAANVLAFGTDYTDIKDILPISLAWLEAKFEGGRHTRRLNEINDIEKKYS